MKEQELRIGNLIYGNWNKHDRPDEVQELCKVVGIDHVGFSEFSIWVEDLEKSGTEEYNSFEPIPLTEEWLLKFGFEFNILTNRYEFYDWRFYITKPANYDGLLFCEGNTVITYNLKYVHQLQNLYFALTGEELTIKK